MTETGLDIVDAILNNPIEAVILFVGGYIAYRISSPRRRYYTQRYLKRELGIIRKYWHCSIT